MQGDHIPSTFQTEETSRFPSDILLLPATAPLPSRTMLDRLPTELLLIIAELAAPQTAHGQRRLFIERRRWFASLASVSRSSWLALRPLIWTEISIFERMVSALVNAVERDSSFAAFTKSLICTASNNDLVELHVVFPRFSNVKSVEIRRSGSVTAPLELSTIEKLGGEPVVTGVFAS